MVGWLAWLPGLVCYYCITAKSLMSSFIIASKYLKTCILFIPWELVETFQAFLWMGNRTRAICIFSSYSKAKKVFSFLSSFLFGAREWEKKYNLYQKNNTKCQELMLNMWNCCWCPSAGVPVFPKIEQTLWERFLQNTPGCLSVYSCVVECVCPFGAYHIKIDLIFVKAS